MKIAFTQKQKDVLSGFFKDVAVGWFIAAFTIPYISSTEDLLTQIRFLASMIVALYVSLKLSEEKK